MRLLIISIALLFMVACSTRQPKQDQSPTKNIKELIAEKTEMQSKLDQSITTSAQAKQAAGKARQEAEIARGIASEKDREAKSLDAIAKNLRKEEVAANISRASWWITGIGALALGLGIFLFLRLGGKTAIGIAIAGACGLSLGVVGLLIAPHWIAWAWGGAGVLGIAMVAGVVYLLRNHFRASSEMVQGVQNLKKQFPKMKQAINKTLSCAQSETTRGIISQIKSKLPEKLGGA